MGNGMVNSALQTSSERPHIEAKLMVPNAYRGEKKDNTSSNKQDMTRTPTNKKCALGYCQFPPSVQIFRVIKPVIGSKEQT